MEQLFCAIPSVLMTIGSNSNVDECLVFAAWDRVAGDLLRKRTNPIEYDEECLVVAVQDETWLRHLEELAPQFLARINSLTAELNVDLIRFIIDPRAARYTEKTPLKKSSGNELRLDDSLTLAAEQILDPDLRQTFLEAAAGYLAKNKKD